MITQIEQQLSAILEMLIKENDHETYNNVSRDLLEMLKRLQSGEYRHTDFLNRNQFDVKKRATEFFSYLDGYYASSVKWQQVIASIPYRRFTKIIDICPGYSPKVQWALQQLGYDKELINIDQDPSINKKMNVLMSLMNKKFNYKTINDSIFAIANQVADLVTANHVLDDLILHDYCSKQAICLQNIYDSDRMFIDITNSIMKEYDYNDLIHKLITAIKKITAENGYFIIANYFGATERALNLNDWYNFVDESFNYAKKMFINEGFNSINQPDDLADFFVVQKYKTIAL